jgi:hypothetical protein
MQYKRCRRASDNSKPKGQYDLAEALEASRIDHDNGLTASLHGKFIQPKRQ